MNPMALLKLKGVFEKFKSNHPKVPDFFAAAARSIDEGSVIEINVTTSEGKTICTNMRVNSDDIEMIRQIKENM